MPPPHQQHIAGSLKSLESQQCPTLATAFFFVFIAFAISEERFLLLVDRFCIEVRTRERASSQMRSDADTVQKGAAVK